MEPFKEKLNAKSIEQIAQEIKINSKSQFDEVSFLKLAKNDLAKLELKARVRQIAHAIDQAITGDYKTKIKILVQAKLEGFTAWPLLKFIEDFGLDDFKTSFYAMEKLTEKFSAEFAIRPFLNKDRKKSFQYIQAWSKSQNVHLRRLASEGTRPKLPWGQNVKSILENLEDNLEFLETLKDDSELYVRKSVANHLNDISKLDQKLFFRVINNWTKNSSPNTAWIIRHASRTLLKKGHTQGLELHGYIDYKWKISQLTLNTKKIKLGNNLKLSFELKNCTSKDQKTLIEYVIYFKKKNDSHTQKPFRLSDTIVKKNESRYFEKIIPMKLVTTRKYYSGEHYLAVQINGNQTEKVLFMLTI